MDYLPRQIPAESRSRYFKVENFLLNHYDTYGLRERFTAVVLKLLCYHPMTVHWGEWVEDPSPALIAEAIETILENHSGWLNMLLPEETSLLVFEWDCLNLALYAPSLELLKLVGEIARSEGLFLWKPET
ncbi:MAG: hypothetical protein IKU62_07880 [Ruminiclostridium sp.]|nr:hypothetical protein [Ruminiclostridium sp.]